jgi:molybdopterin-containing oxidoreductase family iron-sulfur binding subunit
VKTQFEAEMLRAGGRFDEVPTPVDLTVRDVSDALARVSTQAPSVDAYTLIAYPSPQFYDGRSANEPWLREVPDPVTTIAWNDWIEVHPETARKLGIREGDTVVIESDHGRVEAACHVSGGIHPTAIAMPIGFGRRGGLRYAADRGANVLNVLPPHASDGPHASWSVANVRVRAGQRRRVVIALQAADPNTEEGEPFAQVVDPGRIDTDRRAKPPSTSLYPPHTHREHRWGMAIDLNVCTGCNACVVACYAENNVPVVGEQACAMGREMSWIRIERENRLESAGNGVVRVENVFLPMLCQQCDQAPCESVCPVYATYHNPEGLNAQVYARCIGTRFCSNNCPYKVRRFNWSQPAFPSPLTDQLNPDVTVRSAGVMEKCTFCIQRIQAGKQQAGREQRQLRDGEITPACAQTCPSEAIVFGDLLDPESRVARLSADARGYHVLEALNTRPAITYLRRSVPDAAKAEG